MINHTALTGILAGVFTVSLWGGLPVLRSLAELPPMLVAAVAMASAAGLAGVMARFQTPATVASRSRTWGYWIGGVGGLVGALYFYFLALQEGDPARVTLVTYTWPLGFVLVVDRLAGQGLRRRTLLGSAVAFIGLVPLILADAEGIPTGFGAYAAALASGASWVAFSVFLRQHGALSARGYHSLFLHASLVVLALHLVFEATPVATTATDWLAAGLIGVGPYGLAFMAWGYALRQGPASLMGVLAYLVPVIAATLLVGLGWSAPSLELAIAAMAVVAGALVTQGPWLRQRRPTT